MVLSLKLVGGQLGIFRERKNKSHEKDAVAIAFKYMNKTNEENHAGSETPGYRDPPCPFGAWDDAARDLYLQHFFIKELVRSPRGVLRLRTKGRREERGALGGLFYKDTF